MNGTKQFRCWTFLSYTTKITLSQHPFTKRNFSQVFTRNIKWDPLTPQNKPHPLPHLSLLPFLFLNKNRHQPYHPVSAVPKKDIVILLPYLGLQSNKVAKCLKLCVYKFYTCVNLKITFQNTRCIASLFNYKDRITR